MSSLRQQVINSSKTLKSRDMSLKPSSGSYPSYYTLPEGANVWIPKHSKNGTEYYFDIVQFPYGPNFPNELWRTPWKEGEFPHTMIVDFHKNIGPENASVLCPKGCYGERCPVCEDLKVRQADEPDKEKRTAIWSALRVWRRQWYYVVVRGYMEDGKYHEIDEGLQFFECPTVYMQDKLEAIKYEGRSGDVIEYYHADEGRTVKVTYKTKGEYGDWIGHGFDQRIDPKTKEKYILEDEFLEEAAEFPLDRILKRLTYDEIAEIYHAKPYAPKDKEEEETPPPSRTTRVQQPPAEEKQEEQPRRRRRAESTGSQCPAGGKFGVDFLTLQECDDCPDETYNPCEAEKKRIEEENPPVRRRRR